MLQNIPPEITIASFSAVGVLTGYIWNDQSRRLKHIEKVMDEYPFVGIAEGIAKIKTDIDWIKKEIKK